MMFWSFHFWNVSTLMVRPLKKLFLLVSSLRMQRIWIKTFYANHYDIIWHVFFLGIWKLLRLFTYDIFTYSVLIKNKVFKSIWHFDILYIFVLRNDIQRIFCFNIFTLSRTYFITFFLKLQKTWSAAGPESIEDYFQKDALSGQKAKNCSQAYEGLSYLAYR